MSSITVQDYIRKKALGILGLIETPIDPRVRDERLTFINNINEDIQNKLHEYNVWYTGDAEEILNYYSRAQVIDFNYDPIYSRNKKSYFWCVSVHCRRPGFHPWVRKILWRREWQSSPVFLPGKCHRQRSLAGYNPWCHKELDMTE